MVVEVKLLWLDRRHIEKAQEIVILERLLRDADMGVHGLNCLAPVVVLAGQGQRLVKPLANDEVEDGLFGG